MNFCFTCGKETPDDDPDSECPDGPALAPPRRKVSPSKYGLEIVCPICGGRFRRARRSNRYCSHTCRAISLRSVAPKCYPIRSGKREHVLVAERVLGRPLPRSAVVHHVNGIKADNRPRNLVVCQDRAYHQLLHYRAAIVAAGGDPNTHRICYACGAAKPMTELVRRRGRRQFASICRACSTIKSRQWRAANRERSRAYDRAYREARRGCAS